MNVLLSDIVKKTKQSGLQTHDTVVKRPEAKASWETSTQWYVNFFQSV